MTQLGPKRIRLKLDPYPHETMTDVLTGRTPIIWRGSTMIVEVGLHSNGVFVDSLTGISQVFLEVHPNLRMSAALVQMALAFGSLSGITSAEWISNAADKYHGKFVLTPAMTQFEFADPNGQTLTLWLVFHAILGDGSKITLGGTQLIIEEDGVENGIPPIGSGDSPSWNITGNNMQLWNDTQNRFQTIWLTGAPGQETIKIGET